MPGPCSSKKKKKTQARKEKQARLRKINASQQLKPESPSISSLSLVTPPPPTTPSPASLYSVNIPIQHSYGPTSDEDHLDSESRARFQQYLESAEIDDVPEFLKKPCVEDLGNGPRVRDITAFLQSKIAAPPSFDDPLCAEFAQKEVLEMVCTLLPEETAMIVWYNYSRLKSRICPACRRLYHLGDATRHPFIDYDNDTEVPASRNDVGALDARKQEESQRLYDEQRISGICSALCYLLVSHNYPGAVRSTYGRRAEHISDEVWDELDGPGTGAEDRLGLGAMLKMTRCHDLGLAQLIFPDVEWDTDQEDETTCLESMSA